MRFRFEFILIKLQRGKSPPRSRPHHSASEKSSFTPAPFMRSSVAPSAGTPRNAPYPSLRAFITMPEKPTLELVVSVTNINYTKDYEIKANGAAASLRTR